MTAHNTNAPRKVARAIAMACGIDAVIAAEKPRPRLVSRPSGALRSSAAMRQSSRHIQAPCVKGQLDRQAARDDRPANHAAGVYHGKQIVPAVVLRYQSVTIAPARFTKRTGRLS